MKRACVVWMVLLAILLVYPAATPSAKAPSHTDGLTVQAPSPAGNNSGGGTGQSGGQQEGDGDDLAGIRTGMRPTGGGTGSGSSVFQPVRSLAKVWWMYFSHYAYIMF